MEGEMKHKTITEQMLIDLIKEFKKYIETAQQYEFVRLAMIQMKIEETDLKEIVNNQREARAMYRVIASAIGKDYTEFKE